MIKSKVGLEAEFLLRNGKDEIIIPPSSWDRDGFPLLGEIRGREGETVAETVTNFKATEMKILDRLSKGHSLSMVPVELIKLALYKKANRETDWEEKQGQMGKILNIYGTDIEDYSDQVVKNNKIQGIRVSCGLHVHFSCGETKEWEYEEEQYELVTLPIGIGEAGLVASDEVKKSSAGKVAAELLKSTLYLYTRAGYEKKKEIKVTATRLNKPAIYYIVKAMDEAFFERFAPSAADRTKYRQPGFFELKPYGFEYRSLPASAEVMAALPEITQKSFDLLKEINEY